MLGKRVTKAPDKRAIIENANRTAEAAQLALDIVTRFTSLGFFGRFWWLVTGQIGFRPLRRARQRLAAYRSKRNGAAIAAPSEGAV